MLRYKLTDKGLSELKGFVFEHGQDDMMEAYIDEAESLASHAFRVDMPALLSMESMCDDGEFYLELKREWFEVAA